MAEIETLRAEFVSNAREIANAHVLIEQAKVNIDKLGKRQVEINNKLLELEKKEWKPKPVKSQTATKKKA